MRIVSAEDICHLLATVGLARFQRQLLARLEADYARWEAFSLSSRHALTFKHGVIELMPCADQHYYSCKYVNGHPTNPAHGKLSVAALGILSEVDTGYPLLICDMTLATALRTAATAVLAARYLARPDSCRLGIIGTGAQSEFLVSAFSREFKLEEIRYFDRDADAMRKFASNMADHGYAQRACGKASVAELLPDLDMLITATAWRGRNALFNEQQLPPGLFIAAIGGDAPGKTELPPALIRNSKVVVEYWEQSRHEGEIQSLGEQTVHAELHELVRGGKNGRESATELTIFDSVGFALEDYSVLRLLDETTRLHGIGTSINLLPRPDDPRNLFGLLPKPER